MFELVQKFVSTLQFHLKICYYLLQELAICYTYSYNSFSKNSWSDFSTSVHYLGYYIYSAPGPWFYYIVFGPQLSYFGQVYSISGNLNQVAWCTFLLFVIFLLLAVPLPSFIKIIMSQQKSIFTRDLASEE